MKPTVVAQLGYSEKMPKEVLITMDVNCIIPNGREGLLSPYGERYAQLAPKICLGKLGPTDGRQAGLDAQAALRQEVGLSPPASSQRKQPWSGLAPSPSAGAVS